MSKALKTGLVALILAGGAQIAPAQDKTAIIIGNRNYDTIRDVTEATRAFGLSQSLRRAGFDVLALRDLNAEDMDEARRDITDALERGDRVLVFVAGQIASTPRDNYLLATDAIRPTQLMPGANALSLGGLMDLMSDDAGAAVLLVGEARAAFGARGEATPGFTDNGVPQGVTVFAGPIDALVNFASREVLAEGASYKQMADNAPSSVSAHGFLSPNSAFVPAEVQAAQAPTIPGVSQAEIDLFFFTRAERAGTEAAYRDYLDRFPNGLYAAQARAKIADLQKSPEQLAAEAEAALRLTRDQRREIQNNLTMIGYDTNGVDGIFGRGTRAAITRWQQATGRPQTGYLDRAQIQAIEAEAAAERDRQERLDAAFWRQTGQLGTEAGYRAYLNRYPEGLFADVARRELARIDEERRAAEAAQEAVAWEEARAKDTLEAYRQFLAQYPDGANSENAERRIEEIEAQQGEDNATQQAKADEDRALNNPISRLLAERRLAQLGHDPGVIDGRFDRNTRRAIRRFQRANDLEVTGFIDRRTLARLMSNGNN